MGTQRVGRLVEWILKPLLTAVLVVILLGLLVGTFSQQYSFATVRGVIRAKFTPDYERKLSQSLLAELRGGGFTLFIRHASRDGIDVPGSTALDRAYLIDPVLLPADFRWGICLNEFGRVESRLLGSFFRLAKIPIGEVAASPLCRARETAELSVGRIDRIEPALVIDNVLATSAEKAARASGLQRLLAKAPGRGRNRLLFSHGGVLETQGYERLGMEQAGMVILQHTDQGLKVRAIVALRDLLNALSSTLPVQ
jgi:phosphohistidine phosphatase SixA